MTDAQRICLLIIAIGFLIWFWTPIDETLSALRPYQ
jgi:hypothetical protein